MRLGKHSPACRRNCDAGSGLSAGANQKGESVPGYSLVAPKESDFILRLVWIEIDSQDDVDFLASLGMDIWQVGKDHVYGRADDSQVDQIRAAGLELEFVPRP